MQVELEIGIVGDGLVEAELRVLEDLQDLQIGADAQIRDAKIERVERQIEGARENAEEIDAGGGKGRIADAGGETLARTGGGRQIRRHHCDVADANLERVRIDVGTARDLRRIGRIADLDLVRRTGRRHRNAQRRAAEQRDIAVLGDVVVDDREVLVEAVDGRTAADAREDAQIAAERRRVGDNAADAEAEIGADRLQDRDARIGVGGVVVDVDDVGRVGRDRIGQRQREIAGLVVDRRVIAVKIGRVKARRPQIDAELAAGIGKNLSAEIADRGQFDTADIEAGTVGKALELRRIEGRDLLRRADIGGEEIDRGLRACLGTDGKQRRTDAAGRKPATTRAPRRNAACEPSKSLKHNILSKQRSLYCGE